MYIGRTRRTESNDVGLVVVRRFVPEINAFVCLSGCCCCCCGKILGIEIFIDIDRTRRTESNGVGLVVVRRFVPEINAFVCLSGCCCCCCCCAKILGIEIFIDTDEVGHCELNGVGLVSL